MRIATFNVNSLKARLPIVETYLRSETAPDVLCLQETKCQDKDFPADFFKDLGYEAAFRGMKSYNGVAIVSREAMTDVSFGLCDGEDSEIDTCRMASATVRGVRVICTYAPQGREMDSPEFEYKLSFMRRVRKKLEREHTPRDLVLWTGDLNVAPTDIDVTHPENKRGHVCFCGEAKASLADVVSWGLVDIYRKHKPDPGEFSFFDYRVKDALSRNIGWRIDHLLATEPLAERSVDAWTERGLRAMERPSDHTAVAVDLDI